MLPTSVQTVGTPTTCPSDQLVHEEVTGDPKITGGTSGVNYADLSTAGWGVLA
jgi:hypothetical protein